MANCVFWYPRTSHGVIKIREEIAAYRVIEETISDKPCSEYWVRLENIETGESNGHKAKRENIKVTLYKKKESLPARNKGARCKRKEKEDREEVIQFELIQKQASRNGLVLYEYDDTDLSVLIPETDREPFWSAVYHHSKYFYHEHEFHDGKSDSILLPYMEACNNVQEKNNAALIHYLGCYEKKFRYYHDYSKDLLDSVQNRLVDNVRIKTLMKYKLKWDGLFYRLKGAHIYYKTLTGSKYFIPTNENDELHRLILNTEHYFHKIKLIESAIQHRVSCSEALANHRLTMRFGWVGFTSLFLGLVSMYIASATVRGWFSYVINSLCYYWQLIYHYLFPPTCS
jgi:hypothetical protein